MRIGTNVSAINAGRNLNKNNSSIQKDIEKLSSGFKINRASDDASGLAITEKMRSQITALDVASRNCEDGISLVQTADGYLEEVHTMMQRMEELAMKSANGILEDATDREGLQDEFAQLQEEINRIGETANFNGNILFDGREVILDVPPVEPPPITMPKGTTKQVGNFTVTGGTEGVDYRMNSGTLEILTGTLMKITNSSGQENLAIKSNANIVFDNINMWNFSVDNTVTNAKITFTRDSQNTFRQFKTNGKITLNGNNASIKCNSGVSVSGNKGNLTINDATFNALGGISVINGAKFTLNNTTLNSNTLSMNNGTIINISDDSRVTINNITNSGSGGTINGTVYNQQNPAPPIIPPPPPTERRGQLFMLQIGETSGDADKLAVNIEIVNTEKLGLATLNVSTQDSALTAVESIKDSINQLSSQRATLGAYQNRLEHTINNLETTKENIEASKSRIKDTDIAKHMMRYTQANVLTQSAQAMLAQANTQPQQVLSLLQ